MKYKTFVSIFRVENDISQSLQRPRPLSNLNFWTDWARESVKVSLDP